MRAEDQRDDKDRKESSLIPDGDHHAGKRAYQHVDAETRHVDHLDRLAAGSAGCDLGKKILDIRKQKTTPEADLLLHSVEHYFQLHRLDEDEQNHQPRAEQNPLFLCVFETTNNPLGIMPAEHAMKDQSRDEQDKRYFENITG